LEARIGQVCLIFARVEQEAGHVVQAADGDWDLAGSTAYLEYSSVSGALLDSLKEVAKDYPETSDAVASVCDGLRALKRVRDELAHSAAIVDLFLWMRERGLTSLDSPGEGSVPMLLNAKRGGHAETPTDSDVDAFRARASDVGDAAQALGLAVAQAVDAKGVRPGRGSKA
jgi:hypothetical protein